jgi:hypothetical protein
MLVKNHRIIRLLVASFALMWSLGSFASGQYTGPDRDADGNIVPAPKGEQCVEPTADMRANHMKYLLHKRDLTMHEGIRTKTHSLVQCINCHATPNNEGEIVRVFDDSHEHFCASCHAAASVKLDCFECHADRPVSAFMSSQSKHPTVVADDTQPASPASNASYAVTDMQDQ